MAKSKNQKIKKPSDDAKIEFGYYLVAYIDLLGQQERLRAVTGLPDPQHPEQMESFISTHKETYGAVRAMRGVIQNFFDGFTAGRVAPKQLNEEQKRQFRRMSSKLRFQHFSDSIIIYVPLRPTDSHMAPARSVFGVLGAVGATFLLLLSRGQAVRGGIEIGVAMEPSKGEIYGSALARAYGLESKIAKYPRVVLGPDLISYLKSEANESDGDVFQQFQKSMSSACLDMIAVDVDGHAFIDYLGAGFKKHIASATSPDMTNTVQSAYQNILSSSARFQKAGNTTLAFRYTLLRNYFEARLALWSADKIK